MGKLVEITHVSLGGQIDPLDWAYPYLDDEHAAYAEAQLVAADALFLGRRTYEGLSAAYEAMPSSPFVDRMNSIPKFVASRTLGTAGWNATVIEGEVPRFVAGLKAERNLLKYGNGPLDVVLMGHGLIDEFHVLLTPAAVGKGRHMFEELNGASQLRLAELRRFASGVVHLVYEPTDSS
ncbi:MAG TPA: dihydrofolate reductase family protein [Acidimicrobiales bacterium]|nr:dihydrofolate reductase family protein [Acidimicrobiales bacterium]